MMGPSLESALKTKYTSQYTIQCSLLKPRCLTSFILSVHVHHVPCASSLYGCLIGDHVQRRPVPGSSGFRQSAAFQRRHVGHRGGGRSERLRRLQQLLPGHGQDLVLFRYTRFVNWALVMWWWGFGSGVNDARRLRLVESSSWFENISTCFNPLPASIWDVKDISVYRRSV